MNRGTPPAASPARRARFLLSGVVVFAVLGGGSFYLTSNVFSSRPAAGRAAASPTAAATGCDAASCAGSPAGMAIAAPPMVVRVPPRPTGTGLSPSAARSASPSRSASPHPSVSATGAGSAQPTGSASASASSAAPTPAPSAAQGGTAAAQVLALINQARATAGLPALTVTSGLQASSSAHNLLMAGGCGLSHQCPGEAAIADRETAAGVHWTAAGENIGDGGPVADTSAAIAQMAVGLTQSMLNEQPPNDGHRMNILSTSFTHIGIAVYRDGSGTVWLTQDFSNLVQARRRLIRLGLIAEGSLGATTRRPRDPTRKETGTTGTMVGPRKQELRSACK
jgi:uncharacterized protein YkwD